MQEESKAKLNAQPTTTSIDEQLNTTASNEQSSTSAQNDDHSHSFQKLSSPATIYQQAISSTIKNKKSTCLFYEHVEKKVGRRRIYVRFPQSEATVETIKSMAEKSNNSKPLAKHPEPRYWHTNRQFPHLAFNAISEIIKAEIIEKDRVMYLTDLLFQYKSLLLEFTEGQVRPVKLTGISC